MPLLNLSKAVAADVYAHRSGWRRADRGALMLRDAACVSAVCAGAGQDP